MTPKSSELYFIFDHKSIRPLWTHLPALVSRGHFSENVEGVRVLGTPTSKCSNFATTGPYSCRFHSRDNDDLYLTNLTPILKFHVDFRVLVEPAGWRHPIYQKVRNWFRSANKPLSGAKAFKNRKKTTTIISKIDFRLLS